MKISRYFSLSSSPETRRQKLRSPTRMALQKDCDRCFEESCKEIYDTLTTNGAAMANTLGGIENQVSGRRFITVPKKCTHLFEEIKNVRMPTVHGQRVYKSRVG